MTTPAHVLSTSIGDFPLAECRLSVGGAELSVLHTDAVLSLEEETRFLHDPGRRTPYGAVLWPAALGLAHEIAARAAEFRGRRVLELGAGTGLPGLAAAALGARVVLSDRSDLITHICKLNGDRNRLSGVEYRTADWADWSDSTRYDWIIGSDILYADTQHGYLRRIFAGNLAPGGRVLVSDPFRPPSVPFLEGMEADGWGVRHSRWTIGEGDAARAVAVFELAPPSHGGSDSPDRS